MTTDLPRSNENPFLSLPGGGGGAVPPRQQMTANLPAMFSPRPAQTRHEPSAAKKVHALLRGRYVIAAVLCSVGAVTGAVLGWKIPKPQYTSAGLIQLNLTIPSMIGQERLMLQAPQFVGNQIARIQSQRILQAVMDSHEWQETGRGSTPQVQAEFADKLQVESVPGSNFLRVTYMDRDPAVAKAAVSSVIHSYEQLFSELNASETHKKLDLLGNAKTQYNNEIQTKRATILEASRQFNSDTLDAQMDALYASMLKTKDQLDGAHMSLQGVEASVGPTSQPVELTADEIAAVDPSVRDLLAKSHDSDLRYRMLGAKMGLKNTLTIDAEREYQMYRTELDSAVTRFRGKYVAIRVDPTTGVARPISAQTIKDLQTQVAVLQERYDSENTLYKDMGEKKMQIKALNNDIDSVKLKLETVNKNLDEAEAQRNLGGVPNVISYGDAPLTPASDKRKQMAAVGFAGGGLPLGLLLLIGLIDARYRFSDDHNEAMPNIPLLGILPHLPNLSTDPQQATVAAHCVHQIRTMLEIAADNQGRRAIAITSASPTDGKTSLSLSLGLSFAAAGTRTLLIDCDVIGGGLSARMNQTHPTGTLEAVAARQLSPFVQPTDVMNLSILPVGTQSSHHPTILSPAAIGRLINDAKAKYDMVLIDTGPVMGSVEASPVCAAADGVVMVISRGRHRAQVTRALEHLVSIGARMSGVVFNRATTPDFERSMSRLSIRRISDSTALTVPNNNA